MNTLTVVFLLVALFQSEQRQNAQRLLGQGFPEIVRLLRETNAAFLEKQGLTKLEIDERNKGPESPAGNINVLPLNEQNIGAGIVSSVSGSRIITKQLNLIFCTQTNRVMAVQLLIARAKEFRTCRNSLSADPG